MGILRSRFQKKEQEFVGFRAMGGLLYRNILEKIRKKKFDLIFFINKIKFNY